jgi:hypothetical protein
LEGRKLESGCNMSGSSPFSPVPCPFVSWQFAASGNELNATSSKPGAAKFYGERSFRNKGFVKDLPTGSFCRTGGRHHEIIRSSTEWLRAKFKHSSSIMAAALLAGWSYARAAGRRLLSLSTSYSTLAR